MSIPSKPSWRWMLSLSPGSQLCHYSRDNRGDTKLLLPLEENKKQKTVMSFQNSMVCSQSSSGETKRCQVFDEIQSNALKQTFLTIHSRKAKSNVSICVEERLSALTFELQFPCNSLSIRIKGMKRRVFQRTICFNLTVTNMFQKRDTLELCQVYSSLHTHWRSQNILFAHDAKHRHLWFITTLTFQAGIFSVVHAKRNWKYIYQNSWWFRNIQGVQNY